METASRLGSGEVSNFLHSFKRWSGGTALTLVDACTRSGIGSAHSVMQFVEVLQPRLRPMAIATLRALRATSLCPGRP